MVLFKSEPIKEFKQHTKDIVDISWCSKDKDTILTASNDKQVILWNIHDDKALQIYTHSDLVTCVCFKPGTNIFATGSFDENLRFWSIQHKRVINWVDTHSVVTALQFSTDGEKLVSGNMVGDCFIYDTTKGSIKHLFTINCKNKKGFFAKGRKVIDINFTCTRQALVTTADSRIRYIDLIERVQKFKYKGHTNKTMNIRPSLSGDLELIMSASDDGKIYLWRNVEMEDSSKAIGSKGNDRSDDHESFFATTNTNDHSKTPSKREKKSISTKSA